MLLLEDAGGEGVGVVARQNRNGRLSDDRSGVHLRADEMNSAAGDFDAGFNHPPMDVEALERRQQRRVDVEQFAVPAFDEAGGQNAHEAGEADEFDVGRGKGFYQRGFEGGASFFAFAICAMINGEMPSAGLRRALQAGRIRAVGNYQSDCARKRFIFRCIEQRLQICSPAGYQNGELFSGHPARLSRHVR